MISMTTEELVEAYHIKVEEYIRLRIQPKPKWLPYFIWRKILRRLLVLEKFNTIPEE
jgi:hypothetical protein